MLLSVFFTYPLFGSCSSFDLSNLYPYYGCVRRGSDSRFYHRHTLSDGSEAYELYSYECVYRFYYEDQKVFSDSGKGKKFSYLGNEDFYWELDYISGDLKIQYIAPYAREEVYHFSNTVRDDTWYSDENGARLGRLELTYDSSDSNYIIDSNELDAEEKSRLDDSSNLLTNAEQEKILSKLNNVSEKNYFDMVIVTVDSLNGKTEQEYADEYYSNNNFGYGSNSEGIILLVAMKERRVRISARGRENTLDDKCIENIMSSVRPELTAKNYYNAFLSFIDLVENSL